jgi:probable rRNA maturation factor
MSDAPDLTVDIVERAPLWRERVAAIDALCTETARAALLGATSLNPPPHPLPNPPPLAGEGRVGQELSIVLGDDALLRELNGKWRGIDKPTNVLAFPAEGSEVPPDAPRLLGDVVIAFETMAREAETQGKPVAHHLRHLIVHGVLHLLGYDHIEPAEAERMEALEAAILRHLDVPDPYRVSEASDG